MLFTDVPMFMCMHCAILYVCRMFYGLFLLGVVVYAPTALYVCIP